MSRVLVIGGFGLSFADGQQATAAGTVAAVDGWLARGAERRQVGVFGLAEVFELDELLAHVDDR